MTPPGERRSAWRDVLALARPRDWIKNVFVLMPAPFALATGGRLDVPVLAVGVIGFGLVASAVYAMNDVLDAASDRRHPVKRRRPVAAGRLSAGAAWTTGLALLLAGVVLLALTNVRAVWWIVLTYLGINVAYSFGIRRVPLVDVFCLSAGFVLRVVLGCALLQVRPSSWLLVCTSFLALFLSLAKRRGDLAGGLGPDHRPSLAGYHEGFLDHAAAITAAVTLVSYALYCVEGGVLRPGREFASLPFVAFGVLEYLRLVYSGDRGGAPADVLLSSPMLLGCGALWVLAVLWATGLA